MERVCNFDYQEAMAPEMHLVIPGKLSLMQDPWQDAGRVRKRQHPYETNGNPLFEENQMICFIPKELTNASEGFSLDWAVKSKLGVQRRSTRVLKSAKTF